MNCLLYLLGSGLFESPARWRLLGMILSSVLFCLVAAWTIWISLSVAACQEKHRNLKGIIGIIALLLLYALFTFFDSHYSKIMKDHEKSLSSPSAPVYSWDYDDSSHEYIYIYEHINIK